MKLRDFSISKFNETMQKDVSKQKLNFCKAIILSHKKISVTLEYKPTLFHKQYAILKPDLSVDFRNDFTSYYYGASPKIDSFSVIDAISKLSFTTSEGLDTYISKHCAEFMLHEDQAEYLPDIARLILLTVSSKYGIRIKFCDELNFLLSDESDFSETVSQNKNDNTILLHGCPCFSLIEQLKPYRFVNHNDVWQIDDNGISLPEIYSNKSNIKLLVRKVFYSGVLLKALKFSKQKDNFENDGIANYQLIYERSFFAMVCALDNNYVDHPLLKKNRSKLEEFFHYDDNCKMRLSEQLSSDSLDSEQILTHVNEYIKYSYNVNQIGISGNVETSEGEILVGLRDSKNIDDGYFYPSVNGNAEVYDENVQFYNNSVYEDLPTVNIHEKRSDLLGEIAREAYSELNMVSTKESWCCYGMIISGNLPQDKSSDRRCHFNVLFENEINEPFDEIKIRYRKASEAFETKNLAAIIIKCYKSRAHGLLFRIAQFLRYILRSKDFIESILLLLIASISIRNMDFSFENIDLSFENISSILSILFAGIILLTNFLNAIQYIAKSFQNLKSTKRICIYETMSYISLCRRISKAMKMKYHPATYASLKMHIENIIYSNLQNNRNLKKGISKN